MAEGSPPRGQDEPGEQRCSQDDRNPLILGKEDGNGQEQNRAAQRRADGPWANGETQRALGRLGAASRWARVLPVGSQLFKWDEAILKLLWKV